MRENVTSHINRAAYRAQQWSIRVPMQAAQRAAQRVVFNDRLEPDAAAEAAIDERYRQLLETDLRNVEQGLYPRELLFQIPFGTYARGLPQLLRDIPKSVRRMRTGDYQDLPDDVALERYPAYFRRNFHWQTDGYFSRRSAELYDVGVELLFLGMADVMRRQVIPPITRFLQEKPRDGLRLLDVACGTGRTLCQLATAHPSLRLTGVDISPYYLQTAREVLEHVPDVSLVAENGEHLPFRDSHFDIVTSVYLFHELPRNARRRVISELYRVLKPGGLVVIEDSAQRSESGEIAFFLAWFASRFHEPFYEDYIGDELEGMLEAGGFTVTGMEKPFVAKVVVGRKPS